MAVSGNQKRLHSDCDSQMNVSFVDRRRKVLVIVVFLNSKSFSG